MKKKITIFITIIFVLVVVFSTSAFAVEYPEELTFESGTVIVLKNSMAFDTPNNIAGYTLNIKFNSGGNSYTYITRNNTSPFAVRYNTTSVYTTSWYSQSYRTIEITETVTITESKFIHFFIDFSQSITPPPPPPPPPSLEPSFWETVSGAFSEALTSGTAIVNWLEITPIALIPLALYCLIVIIAITKKMIKG